MHSVRRCTFQLRVHFAMIEFFVLFLDSLPTVSVLRTPGKSIYLSMPPSAHSMKKQHQHFFSDQRPESVSQLPFCCDWRREASFAHGLCHLFLRRAPAGLMTHSPAGRLLATAWVSRFTARANATGLMKYASAEAGWLDKKKKVPTILRMRSPWIQSVKYERGKKKKVKTKRWCVEEPQFAPRTRHDGLSNEDASPPAASSACRTEMNGKKSCCCGGMLFTQN